MNKHTSHYLLTHDIDIFFLYRGVGIHYASNGSMIPGAINFIKSLNAARIAASDFRDLLNREQLVINRNIVEELYSQQERLIASIREENGNVPFRLDREVFEYYYLSSFVKMAMKGFYSFDCSEPLHDNQSDEDKSVILTLVAAPDREFSYKLLDHQPLRHPDSPFPNLTDIVTQLDETRFSLKL